MKAPLADFIRDTPEGAEAAAILRKNPTAGVLPFEQDVVDA